MKSWPWWAAHGLQALCAWGLFGFLIGTFGWFISYDIGYGRGSRQDLVMGCLVATVFAAGITVILVSLWYVVGLFLGAWFSP